MNASIVLVGCGKMGGALLSGWLQEGITGDDIVVVEPDDQAAEAVRRLGVTVVASAANLSAAFRPDLVLLAVKPQVMDQAIPPHARFVKAGSTFLSIAAGKTIAFFQDRLGEGAGIIRCMPNTPAAVGRGMTVACANENVTAERRQLCQTLLGAVGEVAWIEDEALMDAVTAVSGSGPAYVFLLVESLSRAGTEAGLPQDLAERLARATVTGAGELLHRSPDSAAILRCNVTSPGGTTAAALEILMGEAGWQPLLTRAVQAAAARSRELSG